MALDVAIDGRNRFGLCVIEIVVIDRVVTDARTDGQRRVGDRLAVLFCRNGKIGNVAVGPENKYEPMGLSG